MVAQLVNMNVTRFLIFNISPKKKSKRILLKHKEAMLVVHKFFTCSHTSFNFCWWQCYLVAWSTFVRGWSWDSMFYVTRRGRGNTSASFTRELKGDNLPKQLWTAPETKCYKCLRINTSGLFTFLSAYFDPFIWNVYAFKQIIVNQISGDDIFLNTFGFIYFQLNVLFTLLFIVNKKNERQEMFLAKFHCSVRASVSKFELHIFSSSYLTICCIQFLPSYSLSIIYVSST